MLLIQNILNIYSGRSRKTIFMLRFLISFHPIKNSDVIVKHLVHLKTYQENNKVSIFSKVVEINIYEMICVSYLLHTGVTFPGKHTTIRPKQP